MPKFIDRSGPGSGRPSVHGDRTMLKTRVYDRLGRQVLVAYVLMVMGLVATIARGPASGLTPDRSIRL